MGAARDVERIVALVAVEAIGGRHSRVGWSRQFGAGFGCVTDVHRADFAASSPT